MNEAAKTYVCLGAIAVLVVVAQTMDYHDQLRMEAEMKAEAHQQFVHPDRTFFTTIVDLDQVQREIHIREWRKENPDLARIMDTTWQEFNQHKARKEHKAHGVDVAAAGVRP